MPVCVCVCAAIFRAHGGGGGGKVAARSTVHFSQSCIRGTKERGKDRSTASPLLLLFQSLIALDSSRHLLLPPLLLR